MHRDSAAQTTPSGLALIIDDHRGEDWDADVDFVTKEDEKSQGVRRHFAQYGDQHCVSDEMEMGWDCGICFETAEDPCVTRCGHLYCQAHLHHWLATHPSCPVCKTPCTHSDDVVPIFSRGRVSPTSSAPSSPTTTRHFFPPSPLLSATTTVSTFTFSPTTSFAPARLPSPPPPQRHADTAAPSLPLSRSSTPRPHPLVTAHVLAHRVGLALRVLALAIFLAVLLR